MGVDVSMSPVRFVSVSGTLTDELGPLADFGVQLFTHESDSRTVPFSVGRTSTDAAGRFVFPLVPPGAYRVVAQRLATTRFGPDVVVPPPGPPRAADRVGASAEQLINVGDQDVTGLTLQLALGVQVRVVATTRPDGTFVFDGLGPGKWRVTGASLPPTWSLRSAVLDGRDTLDAPLEVRLGQPIADLTVTITDRPTVLTGTMFDAMGQPSSEYSIVAFSTDLALWSVPRRVSGVTRLSSDGRFTITGRPPGEYYLAVSAELDSAQLGEASFLESLVAEAVYFCA